MRWYWMGRRVGIGGDAPYVKAPMEGATISMTFEPPNTSPSTWSTTSAAPSVRIDRHKELGTAVSTH
jgi:hypothetical protein